MRIGTWIACPAYLVAHLGSLHQSTERESCGLPQRALAEVSHVSRVTIVNFENGKVGDIGAVKLSEIAGNVGIPLFANGKKMNFIKMMLSHVNTSYKCEMSQEGLETLLLDGKIPLGLEGLNLATREILLILIGQIIDLAGAVVDRIRRRMHLRCRIGALLHDQVHQLLRQRLCVCVHHEKCGNGGGLAGFFYHFMRV